MSEHRLPPSRDGSVVVDIGGDTGALVLYTPTSLAGVEVDIVRRGDDYPCVHTEVRERRLARGTCFAAVFATLPAGDYTVPGVGTLPDLEITVSGGQVAEARWPG